MEDYSKWTIKELKEEFKRLREIKPETPTELGGLQIMITNVIKELDIQLFERRQAMRLVEELIGIFNCLKEVA